MASHTYSISWHFLALLRRMPHNCILQSLHHWNFNTRDLRGVGTCCFVLTTASALLNTSIGASFTCTFHKIFSYSAEHHAYQIISFLHPGLYTSPLFSGPHQPFFILSQKPLKLLSLSLVLVTIFIIVSCSLIFLNTCLRMHKGSSCSGSSTSSTYVSPFSAFLDFIYFFLILRAVLNPPLFFISA